VNYYFKRLKKENLADLLPIYQNAFEKKVTDDFFVKKMNTYSFGTYCIGFIAYDQNYTPVAFYGVYPCELEYNGKIYLAVQSGDTMTHKEHTRKGLFTQLALKTFQACREKGVVCLFGFPNKESYPGFIKKLGCTHFDTIMPFSIQVNSSIWNRIQKSIRLPKSLHIRWCNFILSSMEKGQPFKSSCFSSNTAVVNHSSAFFEYKTYGVNYLLLINGINVWLKIDAAFLFIGDMEKCDELTFLKTIHALKKLAFKLGLSYLRFHSSTSTWGESMFKKIGVPMESKYPIIGINFSTNFPLDKLKFTGADNDTF
jgi:hypothetical protein